MQIVSATNFESNGFIMRKPYIMSRITDILFSVGNAIAGAAKYRVYIIAAATKNKSKYVQMNVSVRLSFTY